MTNRIFKVGQSREQGSFLPARIEDYVAPDNPVRAIEAYVCALDLAELGFRHAEGDGGAGQPPFDPADLLKLYLYGYLNRVRSSRRLSSTALATCTRSASCRMTAGPATSTRMGVRSAGSSCLRRCRSIPA